MSKPKPKVPGSILNILSSGVQGKIKEPNLAEVAQAFFDLVGGERAVAKMLVQQYNDARTPHHVKTKIVQILLNHVKTLNERSGNLDQLDMVTDDDLDRGLKEHIQAVIEAKAKRLKEQQDAARTA